MGGLRRIAVVIACLGALTIAVAGSEQATLAAEPEVATFRSTVRPGALPRQRFHAARLTLDYQAAMNSEARPPALSELALKLDKNLAIDLHDYPSCHPPRNVDEQFDPVACRPAQVGEGELKAAIPLDPPIPASSKVTVYKWRERSGATELFARAEITVPVPAALPITIEIRKHKDGRFGTEATFHFPKIAGGNGSITLFKLHLGKGIGYRHTPRSIVNARCPDGHLETRARMVFADGGEAESNATQPCSPLPAG